MRRSVLFLLSLVLVVFIGTAFTFTNSQNYSAETAEYEMVFIQGGTFDMGDTFGVGHNDERPVHKVTIGDYYLGKHEVTVQAFADFITTTAYQTDADQSGRSYVLRDGDWQWKDSVNWQDNEAGDPRPIDQYNHPVIHVSWNDAIAYCNWLSEQHNFQPVYRIGSDTVTANWQADGYRLPTEAEWEFAARSRGKAYQYAWGNDQPHGNIADSTTHEIYSYMTPWEGYRDGYIHTSPAGTFEQGDLGLTDMTGNVSEWCWDWYDAFYYKRWRHQNPHGPDTGYNRVIRGGSWNQLPKLLRCTFRTGSSPDSRSIVKGFRLARSGG